MLMLTHTEGLDSLNKEDRRKKVRSVVDYKFKAGNSMKMVEEMRNYSK